jgi:hypothetical protein
VVRIAAKTNGHLVKIYFIQRKLFWKLKYQAHIIDKSTELTLYEIPIKNFRFANHEASVNKPFPGDNLFIEQLHIEIESKTEGPFNVEIKYIDFCYDHKAEKHYEKYSLPFFLKCNNKI